MDFKEFIKRTITSFILIFLFLFIFLFYDKYLIYLAYLVYLVIILELIYNFRKKIYIFFISLIYLFFSLFCLNSYFTTYYIKEKFLYTMLIVIIFDIASYIFGTKFGRLKILPIISPNKTYFGLISGFMTAFILGSLINFYYKIFETILMIYFIFFTLSSAFLGDIIESIFKRKSNLKNSSNILQGHGGFFDRFDSLIMVFIFLFLFNSII